MRGLAVALLLTSGAYACDVCGPWSGAMQPEKIIHKQCKNGNTDIDGTYADLAACEAAGGTSMQDIKCSYLVAHGNSNQYTDPQKCAQFQSTHGATCCGGDYTGTLACDVCKPWTGALQRDKIFHKQCKNGETEIDGTYADLAACKSAGGTSLEDLKCSYMIAMGNSPVNADPQKCAIMQSSYGATCCGGDYTGTLACDVCKPWSGALQRDKIFHKQCKSGATEIDGTYPDLAACKSAGGTSLQELKCSYMIAMGNSPENADPQKCVSMQSSYGATCCGGDYTGTLACDVCMPPSGPTCMIRTPSGCPNSVKDAKADWTPWSDPSVTEETCAGKAAEGNAYCGVTDAEVKWGAPPQTEKKCLQSDKTFYKICKNGATEIDGTYPDLAACQAAGGTLLQDLKCSYMLAIGNSPEYAADPQKCASAQTSYGSSCCTATCPTTTTTTTTITTTTTTTIATITPGSSVSEAEVAGTVVALGCMLLHVF